MAKRTSKTMVAAPVATDQRGRVTIGNAYKAPTGWAGYYVIKLVGASAESRVQVTLQTPLTDLDAWALRFVAAGNNVKVLAQIMEGAFNCGFAMNAVRTRARQNMWYNPEAALAADLADRPQREECSVSTFGDNSAVNY